MTYDELFDKIDYASEKGNLVEVKSLLPRLREESGNIELDLESLLRSASHAGHVDVIMYFLFEGATLDAKTPILAAKHATDGDPRYIKCFQEFINHGWDVNSDHPNYGTALM